MPNSRYPFAPTHKVLRDILEDHNLAKLGDAYINFTYSLALSNQKHKPTATKVKGAILAQALKNAGMRQCLPSHMTTHKLADAAEALIIYLWLNNQITIQETVKILTENRNQAEAFTDLLIKAKRDVRLS